jgi:hypothetical protein
MTLFLLAALMQPAPTYEVGDAVHSLSIIVRDDRPLYVYSIRVVHPTGGKPETLYRLSRTADLKTPIMIGDGGTTSTRDNSPAIRDFGFNNLIPHLPKADRAL